MRVVNWGRVAVTLVALGLVGATARVPAEQRENLGEFVPVRPELTRVLMKSSLPMVVDIYWLRAINAIGTARTASEHRNLAEYGRVLTALDPDFNEVYWLIGLTLPFNRGREDWVNGELAVALLEQGDVRFPTDLRLKLLLGYSLMSFTDRPVDAARVFLEASKLPDAPRFAALLATRLLVKGEQLETAITTAEAMRDAAGTDEERALFQDRVNELTDERLLRTIDAAAAAYKAQHGAMPASIDALTAAGLLDPDLDLRIPSVRFDKLGRALLPNSRGRVKVFHDSFGGMDYDAPETWR